MNKQRWRPLFFNDAVDGPARSDIDGKIESVLKGLAALTYGSLPLPFIWSPPLAASLSIHLTRRRMHWVVFVFFTAGEKCHKHIYQARLPIEGKMPLA